MYKIYFTNRCLVLSATVEEAMTQGEMHAIHKYSTINELRQFVDKFNTNDKLTLGCIYFHDVETLWQQFRSLFRLITAAGGLVRNAEGRYLVINRLGVPDLPKGKAEAGETPEQTAVREVMEETGLEGIKLGKHIADTYHTYPLKGETVLKTTHWYGMTVEGVPALKPQTEENITAAEWLTAEEIEKQKGNSYPSIRVVLDSAK